MQLHSVSLQYIIQSQFNFQLKHVLEAYLKPFTSWQNLYIILYIMQIVTGIEVNSEADFPKLREYCPSAEGNVGNIPATSGN